MKSPYVSELQPNQTVNATFLVHSKEVRQKKTGEPYLSLTLGDKTGEIGAKMWDNVAEVMDTFDRDDYVRVKGLTQVYQNKPQLTVHKLIRVDEREVDAADFFPASRRDPEEMFRELEQVIASIGNAYLRQLLERVFADPEMARLYRSAPAAKSIHHAYLGGLIEHVLSLCALCKMAAGHYPYVDLDLLLAGAILHDIGKVKELNYERTFTYSAEGQLIGHITMGALLIEEKSREVEGFPPNLKMLLMHMVISHHGELEYGSPKVPLFPEALLLHHLDNLDSKMEAMRWALEKDQCLEGLWTSYSPALDRIVLKKERFLSDTPDPQSATNHQQPEQPVKETSAGAPARPKQSRARESRTPSLFGEKLKEALTTQGK